MEAKSIAVTDKALKKQLDKSETVSKCKKAKHANADASCLVAGKMSTVQPLMTVKELDMNQKLAQALNQQKHGFKTNVKS